MQFVHFSYTPYINTVYMYLMFRTDFICYIWSTSQEEKTPSTQCILIGPHLKVSWFLTRFVTSSAQGMLKENSALLIFSLKLMNII